MGKVVLSRAIGAAGFERLVALKRMNAELLESDELVRRFVDEARVAAHVRHANVVAVHHFGRDAGGYYLVLDYVEGVSIDALIERCTELGVHPSPPIVLRIVADALAGLQAVHETKDPSGKRLDILHRDVSTQNVLVGCDGLSRLSDFGIAKSVLATHQTAQNRLVGKLLYMPPEYLRQQRVDRTLDVYAMGMTLWVALAGGEPWPELNDAQLLGKILHDRLPSLATTGARLVPGLDEVVQKACARDPAQRFPTASAMGSAIAALGRSSGWMATHVEVAEFVEELCGDRLERLRRQVRESHVSVRPPPNSSAPEPSRSGASRHKWSAVGVQKIRVVAKEPAASEASTHYEIEPPAQKGTLAGIGPSISAGRGGTQRVPELANAPATANPEPPKGTAPLMSADTAALDGEARRARSLSLALIIISIATLLLAAAIGAWASCSAASRADAPDAVVYG